MVIFRRLLGEVLRSQRMRQGRTLRQVSADARVSLGYISEVERGQKEASSELLAAICAALDVPLSEILSEVSDAVALEEAALAMQLESVSSSRSSCRPATSAPAATSSPPPPEPSALDGLTNCPSLERRCTMSSKLSLTAAPSDEQPRDEQSCRGTDRIGADQARSRTPRWRAPSPPS